jgi:cell wall-associated NlpC family hydrolase
VNRVTRVITAAALAASLVSGVGVASTASAAPIPATEFTPELNTGQRAALQAKFLRDQVLDVARAQLGRPYIAGQSGPRGFDCSGLTRYVFEKAIGQALPRTSREQFRFAKRIPAAAAQPGDLVFFFESGAHHVGIYIGGGRMIDAPNSGERVSVNPISGSWWGRSFTGFGRILPAVQA